MTSAKTVKLYHPSFADVVEEVPADRVDDWTEAGWRKDEAEGTRRAVTPVSLSGDGEAASPSIWASADHRKDPP